MDDRTHDTLDALADLFLTGTGPRAVRDRDPLSAPAPIRLPPKRLPPRPDADDGDAPTAKVTPDRNTGGNLHTHVHDHSDAVDEVVTANESDDAATRAVNAPAPPALRLHRDDDDDDAPAGEHRAAALAAATRESASAPPANEDEPDTLVAWAFSEAVFVGNLPGFSGPWLTQYAQMLADAHGPVAVLHLDENRLELELVEPTGSNALAHLGARAKRNAQDDSDLIETLGQLLRAAPAAVQTILVNLPADAIDERVLPWASRIETWTLLTGSDDAAVVHAYGLLKRLVDACPRDDEAPSWPQASHRIGIMVMGSDEATSRAAAAKLHATAHDYLHAPLEYVGHRQQMAPVNVRQLGAFTNAAALRPRVLNLLEQVKPVEALTAEPAAVVPAPAPTPTPASTPKPAPTAARTTTAAPPRPAQPAPAAPTPRRSASIESPPAPAGGAPAAAPRKPVAPTPTPPLTPAPTPIPQPAAHAPLPAPAAASTRIAATSQIATPSGGAAAQVETTSGGGAGGGSDQPNLASFLLDAGEIPGGIILEARCPQHPLTQIVLDQDGRMHLLRRHDLGKRGSAADLRTALVDLLEVRAWVRDHLKLLALTQRQCQFDGAALPALHLFTDRADLAVGLIARLGDTLHLHLLQEIALGHASGWYCTKLN
jgi:hypothetical protein